MNLRGGVSQAYLVAAIRIHHVDSLLPSRLDQKMICVPSGDQRGSILSFPGLSVSWIRLLPSAFIK